MKPIFTSKDKAQWPTYAGWSNDETSGPGIQKGRKLSFFESLTPDHEIVLGNILAKANYKLGYRFADVARTLFREEQ